MSKKASSRIRTKLARYTLPLTILLTLYPAVAYAAGAFITPNLFERFDVYSGGSNYTPNVNGYPYDSDSTTQIGFDSLYGSGSLFNYKGEVPTSLAEDETLSQLRTYTGDTIDGQYRPWSDESGLTVADITPESTDPHIQSMTQSAPSFNLWSIMFSVVSAMNWAAMTLVSLMISIKNFDIGGIIPEIDKNGDLSNTLATLFAINPETGTISPFLVFAIAMFIAGFIGLAFRVVLGRMSGRKIFEEFGYFLMAAAFAGLFFTSMNATSLSSTGVNFLNGFTADMAAGTSDSTIIFSYDTNDPGADSAATQKSAINKTEIDQLVLAQTGYNVKDLDIQESNGTASDLGTLEDVTLAMQKTFPGGDINSMALSTDSSGNNVVNNLGYYLLAANSGVAIYNGEDGNPSFYASGNGTLVNKGSSDRILYAVDFLSNLRTIAVANDNNDLVYKIDKIISNMQSPDYASATWTMFLLFFQKIALAFGLSSVTIFMIMGQLIVVVGGFSMVVMPALLLIPATRKTAKQIIMSFVIGFIRFLVGSALFNAIIFIVVVLSEQGTMGIIMSILVSIALAKFGPQLIATINREITNRSRGEELGFVSSMNSNMNRKFETYPGASKARRANNMTIDEDGNVVSKDSMLNSLAKRTNRKGRKIGNENRRRATGGEEINEDFDPDNDYSYGANPGDNDDDYGDEDLSPFDDLNNGSGTSNQPPSYDWGSYGDIDAVEVTPEGAHVVTEGNFGDDYDSFINEDSSSTESTPRKQDAVDNDDDIEDVEVFSSPSTSRKTIVGLEDMMSGRTVSKEPIINNLQEMMSGKIVSGDDARITTQPGRVEKSPVIKDLDKMMSGGSSEKKPVISGLEEMMNGNPAEKKPPVIKNLNEMMNGKPEDNSQSETERVLVTAASAPIPQLSSKMAQHQENGRNRRRFLAKKKTLDIASNLPIIGSSINKAVTGRIQESNAAKNDILKNIGDAAFKVGGRITLDEAFDIVKDRELSSLGGIARKSRERELENLRVNITSRDLKVIKDVASAKKKHEEELFIAEQRAKEGN